MLALIKKIGEERLEAMTAGDYILLSKLFHGKELGEIHPEQFDHLAELEIVRQTVNGIEFANGTLSILNGKGNGTPTDCQAIAASAWQSLEPSDTKKQIIAFIVENENTTSSQLAKFTGLSQGRVRTMLQGLVADGVIVKVGDNRYTTYKLKSDAG
jgi:hypothetical protein